MKPEIKTFFPKINIPYTNSKEKIPELDGIRGLAIALVIGYHCFKLAIGWVGVDLFFVLSGFLITGILLDTKDNQHYYKNFWARRVLRIFPLYYAVLILILLPAILFKINTIDEPSITYWFYAQNWKFTFDGNFHAGKGTLNHFWSLAIEEQFYLIFPIIIKLFKPKALFATIISFIAIAIVLRFYLFYNDNIGYYLFTFSRIDSLLIGAALAYLIRNNKELIIKYIHFVFIFSLSIIILIMYNGSWQDSYKHFGTFGYTIVALFFATLIIYSISTFKHNPLKKIFNNNILKYLGKIAYGLYVFHFIFYVLFKPALEKLFFDLTESEIISKMIGSIVVLILTLITSYISYHFFEKRFLKMKKKFI